MKPVAVTMLLAVLLAELFISLRSPLGTEIRTEHARVMPFLDVSRWDDWGSPATGETTSDSWGSSYMNTPGWGTEIGLFGDYDSPPKLRDENSALISYEATGLESGRGKYENRESPGIGTYHSPELPASSYPRNSNNLYPGATATDLTSDLAQHTGFSRRNGMQELKVDKHMDDRRTGAAAPPLPGGHRRGASRTETDSGPGVARRKLRATDGMWRNMHSEQHEQTAAQSMWYGTSPSEKNTTIADKNTKDMVLVDTPAKKNTTTADIRVQGEGRRTANANSSEVEETTALSAPAKEEAAADSSRRKEGSLASRKPHAETSLGRDGPLAKQTAATEADPLQTSTESYKRDLSNARKVQAALMQLPQKIGKGSKPGETALSAKNGEGLLGHHWSPPGRADMRGKVQLVRSGTRPETCPCFTGTTGSGKCYYYTNEGEGTCAERKCSPKYHCTTQGRSTRTCMLRKLESRVVRISDGSCETVSVRGSMYVPYL